MGEYKPAILFLVRYVVLYVVLNTAYAYYIDYYAPDADPMTVVVTRHTDLLLSVFDNEVASHVVPGEKDVPVTKGGEVIMKVFEGCNAINVMIVFACFLVAFRGPAKLFLRYFVVGLVVVYLINLLRLAGLYLIALYSPDVFYFFHKFFFTGAIYLVVFGMWYLWITDIKKWNTAAEASKAG